jgi:dephospho-CoA kinase
MAFTVGITGGIASGKTIVAKIFEILGYPVYYSDIRAKDLMNEDVVIKQGLRFLFGDEVYVNDTLNRPYLAEKIFNSPSLREKVNSIVHPVVRKDFEIWTAQQNSLLVFQESALLFETGSYKSFDAVILVVADENLRIQRIVERDNISNEEAIKRIQAQLPDSEKRKRTKWVVENNEKQFVTQQILKLIEQLIAELRLV